MDIYIDKDHLYSYLRKSSDSRFSNYNNALKENLNIHFLFPKAELLHIDGESDEIHDKKEKVKQWVNLMSEGVGETKIFWKEKLPTKNHKEVDSLDVLNATQLSSLYWVDGRCLFEENDNNRIIYVELGQELDSLSTLMIKNFNKQLETRKMHSWGDIRPYISPCSDIIFVDQYIFSSPEVYEYNIYSLLKVLCSYGHLCKLNIVFFTKPYSLIGKIRIEHDWKKIMNGIKDAVCQITGTAPNVTFVLATDLKEHDRYFFTNYKASQSGDTYNYFDSKGEVISNGRFLQIFSLLDSEYYEHWNNIIVDLQTKVYDIYNNNPDYIKGDKKCHYLIFPNPQKTKGIRDKFKINKNSSKRKK